MADYKEMIGKFVLKYLVVPKAPKVEKDKIRIACIGDSITYGAGVIGKNYKRSTWEYFLQQKLGDDYQVLNYGISGRTLQNEGDYPYRKEKFYRITHKIQAEIYIIMLGTNDAKPYNWNFKRYRDQFRRFVAGYKKHSNQPKIYIMAPSKCFVDESIGKVGYDILNENIERKIHPFILDYARQTGTECIDLYELSENHPEWFDDGVHPNAKGNEAFAQRIFEHIDWER